MFPDVLSNIDLDSIGKVLFGPLWKGVYNKDELPHMKQNGIYLVNLQSSNQHTWEGKQGGTHWVAVLLSRHPHDSWYFDPFGCPPPEEVIQFIGHGFPFSTKRYQNLESHMCGWFDLYAMSKRIEGKPSFLDPHGSPLNDIVLEHFKKDVAKRFV